MAHNACALLDGTAAWSRERLDYVLAAGLLGHIAAGEPARALALWQAQAARAEGDRQPAALFRLLLAHSEKSPTGKLARRD